MSFDRLIKRIIETKNPTVAGLDPSFSYVPEFIREKYAGIADPLEAANLCWEENPHAYRFPICELLRETGAKDRLPPAGPEPPQKLSVREQLRTAMREARQQPAPEERPKDGGTR